MKFNFKLNLKVSAFYLEKQKSFIPKKKFFRPLSISKQKSFVYGLNFPEGFDHWIRDALKPNSTIKYRYSIVTSKQYTLAA
jgi:hypothetical protein